MRKTLLLTLILLTSAVWLQAQDSGQMSNKSSSPTTIEGCLKHTDGHYRLTDSNGAVYQLSNEANKLTHYVGQQIKVTGMMGVRTVDTTIQGAASSAKEQPVFKVKTVTHVADTCKSPGQ
ncbi:MAG: hypothetical protein WA655_02240 [Candidatus Korobacteraceae bacterium]